MDHNERLEQASALLDSLYEKTFSDEARVVSLLNIPKSSPEALIEEMSNSMRYIGLSLLRDKLGLKGMDYGVSPLIDKLESKSKRRMLDLASKFLTNNEMSMSDMLRPGRAV